MIICAKNCDFKILAMLDSVTYFNERQYSLFALIHDWYSQSTILNFTDVLWSVTKFRVTLSTTAKTLQNTLSKFSAYSNAHCDELRVKFLFALAVLRNVLALHL